MYNQPAHLWIKIFPAPAKPNVDPCMADLTQSQLREEGAEVKNYSLKVFSLMLSNYGVTAIAKETEAELVQKYF